MVVIRCYGAVLSILLFLFGVNSLRVVFSVQGIRRAFLYCRLLV